MFSLFKFPIRRPPRRPVILARAYQPMGQFGGSGNDIFYNANGGEGPPGPPGPAGVSVVDAQVESNPGDLLITLSDGTVINAGNVIGPAGPPGPPGPSSMFLNVILVDKDYTISNNNQYIGATEKNITITLPMGTLGRVYYIKNESSGNIKVVGTSGQTIDGSAFQTLGTNGGFMVVFDGTRWNIL